MRPLIAITCRLITDLEWCPPLTGVREGYINAIIAAGGAPMLVPPQVDEATLRTLYEAADGILLSGGADVDPSRYGEAPHPQLGPIEPLRDAIEIPLARWAVADRKPLLAICRGVQVLNVALGGTLYQDIGSDYQTTTEHDYGSQCQSWEHLVHAIQLDPGSRLAEMLGTDQLEVNSLHHQALKVVSDNLRVVGRAPDGIIEAVEGREDAFVVGVQCHPEQLWQQADMRWRRVFEAFVDASRR